MVIGYVDEYHRLDPIHSSIGMTKPIALGAQGPRSKVVGRRWCVVTFPRVPVLLVPDDVSVCMYSLGLRIWA